MQQWVSSLSEYEANWNQLAATIKGAAIDPIIVDCTQEPIEMLTSASRQMESLYIIVLTNGGVLMCHCVCSGVYASSVRVLCLGG